MSSELLTETIDDTLVLTLSGPEKRNALSPQLLDAGIEVLATARSAPEVRCVLIKGAGRDFCAGGDLERLRFNRDHDLTSQGQQMDRIAHFIEDLQAFPKPVLAAVEGAAAGAGFAIALACDLIIAAEDARFALSYGRVGLSPDAGCTWHLMQSLPRQLVAEWLFLGEPVAAPRLHAMGMVNWIVASGQAFERAREIARRLAGGAPNAMASAKELIRNWPGESLTAAMKLEREHFLRNLTHPNTAEGFAAFFEKRRPHFD